MNGAQGNFHINVGEFAKRTEGGWGNVRRSYSVFGSVGKGCVFPREQCAQFYQAFGETSCTPFPQFLWQRSKSAIYFVAGDRPTSAAFQKRFEACPLDGRAKMISRDGMGEREKEGRVAYGKEHFNLSKLAPPCRRMSSTPWCQKCTGLHTLRFACQNLHCETSRFTKLKLDPH